MLDRFRIDHPVLQFETADCGQGAILCELACNGDKGRDQKVETGSGLLAVFIGALTFNLIRGLDIHCGCFSTEAATGPADLWTVARDAGFLVASVVMTIKVYRRRAGTVRVLLKSLRLKVIVDDLNKEEIIVC